MSSDEPRPASGGSSRRIARPSVPPGPLRELKELLHRFYLEAGAPTLDEIHAAAQAHGTAAVAGWPGRDSIHRIIASATIPPSQPDTVAVAQVLARMARQDPGDAAHRACELWVQATSWTPPGTPLQEISDPFALEVHRPITAEGPQGAPGVPVLPPYLRRPHDDRLAAVVARVLDGCSAMAVLVAGSSAGKTRACWEALTPLREAGGWRLWHPYDPTRPEAALQELDRVGPRTVVWLNETQDYLGGGEAGERVAAGLRTLLADASRAPVLVLGTLWPQHHTTLTQRPESQVRQVLDGTIIEVPATFAGTDPVLLREAAGTDLRLAEAIEHAEDGQITQYLAGGPELLARLSTATPEAKALIVAAMDARRLGHRNALPLPLLEHAAQAYLTDLEYDQLGEDWLEQALAYTAEPCKGARGPLTRIRTRPSHRDRRPAPTAKHCEVPVYRLADYLDQHGRRTRADTLPPTGFWTAAAAHTHPTDQDLLGDAAWRRGLYRDATQLHKNATTHGDPRAARTLVGHLRALHPTDHRPAAHAVAHTALDPHTVAALLRRLRGVGGVEEQVAALLARDPAAHAALDNPRAVAELLFGLRGVGAEEQVSSLAERATAHIALNDPEAVVDLLRRLQDLEAEEQVAVLLARDPAAHAALDNPRAVAELLFGLRGVGAEEQVAALLARDPAAHVAIDDPRAVADLLRRLQDLGAEEQVAVLLARDPAAHVAIDDPRSVALLLFRLRDVEAKEHVSALAQRAVAHVAIDDPRAVAELLFGLRGVGGVEEQVAVLLARDPAAHAALDNPRAIALLLGGLRDLEGEKQMSALAQRAVAHVAIDDPRAVAELLLGLRGVGGEEQVAALLARDPAAHAALDNPRAVGALLSRLRGVGAEEQVAALLARDPAAHAALDNPYAVGALLSRLRGVGAEEQVAALLARDPAAHAALDNPRAVADLLFELRDVGAAEQVAALAERLPPAGMFAEFLRVADHRLRYQFGRERDRSPANRWGWEDLE